MRIANLLLIAGLVTGLSGCVTTYVHPANTPLAKLNLEGTTGYNSVPKSICVDGTEKALKPDSTGYSDIPAGRKLTVVFNYSNQGAFGSQVCKAFSSFYPEPGKSYVTVVERDAFRCRGLIFLEDSSKKTGLSFEPSIAPGEKC
ncbi:hypothetical protein [Undibacterium luofuense]|uniref:Lipoprotein n=1 Tax=Undibacterium luofuense TaxID=2828733 RepID=A0A941I7A7_9BURK|nr:hypothetical protein [Undibacterium luofuense]MBR7783611.1 hypothetical protein [Undibacterium luofuense]